MFKNEIRYYFWGTGYEANRLITEFPIESAKLNIVGYIDNDIEKVGKTFNGCPIYSPKVLENDREAYLIVKNKFRKEILQQLKKDYPYYSNRIDNYFMKRIQLIQRYENNLDIEIQDIIKYLQKNILGVFNYPFVQEYLDMEPDIRFDEKNGLFYVIHNQKKMYFAKRYHTAEAVRKYYLSVLLEQDNNSPHKYVNDEESLKDSVIVDAGVAEGNFSIEYIDKAKHIYMFEPDLEWVEALRYTFEPWKDKVTIIPKCVSDYSDEMTVMIDEEVKENIDFIKMDIEGEELYALRGAQNHLKNDNRIKCSICTYHQEHAYWTIKDYIEKMGMQTETTNGYMWFIDHYNEFRPPVLRRGIIRAMKESINDL